MPKNLGQKGLTKGVKFCVKRTPDFVSKESNGCQKGYYGVKTSQNGVNETTPALAGLIAGYFRS
jgi:hypothetical protein